MRDPCPSSSPSFFSLGFIVGLMPERLDPLIHFSQIIGRPGAAPLNNRRIGMRRPNIPPKESAQFQPETGTLEEGVLVLGLSPPAFASFTLSCLKESMLPYCRVDSCYTRFSIMYNSLLNEVPSCTILC